MQSICFNLNIYYCFPISCNTSTHNDCHTLHYIVIVLIRVVCLLPYIISTTLQLIKEENQIKQL